MRPARRIALAVTLLSALACSKARSLKEEAAVANCTACHGGTLDDSGAPPRDLRGRTDPALPSVGAHPAHVAAGLDCSACHPKPAAVTWPGHMDGSVTLAWGGLATTGGAAPSYAGGACASTYCHGATLGAGGTNHTPRWTGGASEAACGACHGLPPPAPHPQNARCDLCHAGYTSTSVNPAVHVNGVPDVAGLSCTTCHGDADRPATAQNPQLPAAPPKDTRGGTDPSASGVGAHAAHLSGGALRGALACGDCHDVPTSTVHATGTTTFHWSALATGAGASAPSYGGGRCSGTYCHGATLAGGTNQAPAWTGGAPEAVCGACHGVPPPSPHPQNPRCGGCHGAGYSTTTVDAATHVNGVVDVGALTCTSCHGDAKRPATALDPQLPAAPPLDTHGEEASARVGAHPIHLNGSALSGALACTSCHPVPESTRHADAQVDFQWSALATGALTPAISTNGAFGGFSAATAPAYANGSCAATYCHGSYAGTFTWTDAAEEVHTMTYAGSAATPSWSGTAACGSCHGVPPSGTGAWHGGSHGGGNDCSLCHPDAAGTAAGGDVRITDPALHVDGKVDMAATFRGACFGCH